MTEAEGLIKTLGWKYEPVSGGNELLIETCPYCGKGKHFYVNRETGRFYCQHGACNARGGIYQLQVFARQAVPVQPISPPKLTVDPDLMYKVELWHKKLWGHQKALDFLIQTRRFSRKAIMHFKLGIKTEYGVDWIVMPHMYRGEVSTLKFRRLDQKQYRHLKDTQLGLFHQDAVDGEGEVLVAEGEMDCMALWSNGYRNVVATPGVGKWRPEWMDMFSKFNKIYICMDQDDAGKLGAKELAKKLGYDRCYNVTLPIGIKDVNDFFIHSSKGKSKFQRMLDQARLVDVPYVIKASDSVRDLILKKRVAGDSESIKTPWEGLNKIIHGIVPESLVIITSYPGIGKCYQIGTKILMYDGSFENIENIQTDDQLMGPDSKPRKVLSTINGKSEMYKITPIKGKPFVCNGDHILSLTSGHTGWKKQFGEFVEISVRDCLKRNTWFQSKAKLWKTGVEFKEKEVPFDPYLVGVHLGDGDTKNTAITLGDNKKEIKTYLGDWCQRSGYVFNKVLARKWAVSITTNNKSNPWRAFIKTELWDSNQRKIPKDYLINSRENRLQLLAGLLDTDGCLLHNCYEVVTKYPQLADGIVFLAGSLGFCITRRTKVGTIKSLNFKGKYERLFISGNIDQIPCKVKRKQASPRKQIKHPLFTGFTIEEIGEDAYYGFALEGDGLHLLEDFTVSHNSTAALQWMYHLAQEGRPVGYVCIEMSSEEMTNRLLSLHTRIPVPTPDEKITALNDLGSYPLYWIDLAKFGGVKFEVLMETLRDAVPRYDLKMLVIDHMHFMIRSVKYQYQETGHLTQKFKLLARELGIPIVCIAHVTKPTLRADGTPKKLVGSDLRDCVPGHQIVYGSGKRMFVKDIKPGMSVVSLGASLRLQNDVVQDVWETGEKDIYRLTTKTGRVIKCSDGHKFFACSYKVGPGKLTIEDRQGPTINSNRLIKGNRNGRGLQGWTRLKDLKIGQKIAIVREYPDTRNETISVDRACLLGWIIGDGHITRQGYTEVTTSSYEEAVVIKELADREFGLSCKISEYKDKNAFRVYLTNVCGKPNKLARWFRTLQFFPVGKDKYVPNLIFEQSRNVIGAFLSGLFQADGCVKNNGTGKSPLIKLSTISKQLAFDTQHLLTRLGIISYVYPVNFNNAGYQSGNARNWEVRFTGSNILKFKSHGRLYLHKQDKLNELINNWKPKDKERKMDLFFDKIKSIEFVGREKTYDIQVEGKHCSLENHSLCVNDILTHNSGLIYGDSDYIFILHRKPELGPDNTWEGEWEPYVEIGVFKSRHSKKGSIKNLEFYGEIGCIS